MHGIWIQLPVGLLTQLVGHCKRYHRGRGFNSRTSLNFFRPFFYYCLRSVQYREDALIFISWNTAVHIYDFYLFTVIYSSLHVFIWNQNNDQFSVSRALRRYRRGHGFKSSSGLNFFRRYFHYCLSSVHYCEDWQFFCSSVQWGKYDSHKLSEYFSSIIPRTCFGGCSLPFCKK